MKPSKVKARRKALEAWMEHLAKRPATGDPSTARKTGRKGKRRPWSGFKKS